MGIRETVNRNPGITAGAVGGVIVLAIIWIAMTQFGGGPQSSGAAPTKFWYTVDDGATYFPDRADRVPPFSYNGKTAVLCHVFTCGDRKDKMVVYLERYTPEGQKRRQEMIDKKQIVGFEELEIMGKEIKAPKTGEKGWMKKNDQRASDVMTPKCKPDEAGLENFPD